MSEQSQCSRRLGAMLLSVCAVVLQGQAAEEPQEPPLTSVEDDDPGYVRIANPAFPSPDVREVPVDRGRRFSRADLGSYFLEGNPRDARAAFELGRYADVRTALQNEPQLPPHRYLNAFAALRLEDWAAASREFEALAEVWPPLHDRCLILAGTAFEQLKDWASAERVYSKVPDTSRQRLDAVLGLSRSLKWLKKSNDAKKLLEPFAAKPAPPWGRDHGAEALLALADLNAFKKDAKAEREALVKLWAAHPMSPNAVKAEARLGDVGTVGTDALVTRADALIDAHRNQQGLDMLEPLIGGLKLPDPLACRAHAAYGKGQRKQRQHAKAVAALTPVVKQCKDPDLKAKAQFVLGFSKSVTEPRSAIGVYEQLAASFPAHAYADDSLFFAADLSLRAGDTERALKRLGELSERYPSGDFAAEALFKKGWIRRQEKNWDEAIATFETIETRFATNEESYEVERAQYWRARTFEAKEDKTKAAELYAALSTAHPATYYGLISRERLATLDAAKAAEVATSIAAPPDAKDPFPMFAGPLGDDLQFLGAVELLRMDFGELVPGEVLSIDRTGLPADSLRLMVHVLSLAGETRAAHGMARLWLRRDLSGRVTDANRAIWEIAYPNVFRDLVVKHCDSANKLDPDLLQALMREESALDAKALSWAGALGLCQLMPATAADVARQLKLKRPSQGQLLEPDLNIRLGSQYLSDLVKRFKGTHQYAIASYNAGEGAIARWRRQYPNDALDEWVEDIPLTETRGYVKRVLRSYNTYKLLYGTPLQSTQLATQ